MKTLYYFVLTYIFIIMINMNLFSEENLIKNNENFYFIENKGQWDKQVKFLAKVNGLNAWITNNGIVFDFFKIDNSKNLKQSNKNHYLNDENKKMDNHHIYGDVIKMTFENTNPNCDSKGENKQDIYHNFYIGKDPSKWAENVPLFQGVKTKNIYNGIDKQIYFDNGKLRYDIILQPGANVNNVKLKFEGQYDLKINQTGELSIFTSLGEINHGKIFAYQVNGSQRKTIECKFKSISNESVGFEVGKYDATKPLIIDPLVYCTYIGGSNSDQIWASTVDDKKPYNIYITGTTISQNFPTISGAYDNTYNGTASGPDELIGDTFFSKFTSAGVLRYSTYLGGSDVDAGTDINYYNGQIYICGYTSSIDFPVKNGWQTSMKGDGDGFAVCFSSLGSLLNSTYLGGAFSDDCRHIIAMTNGIYVCGTTYSDDFPTTPLAYRTTKYGKVGGFISRFSDLDNLINSTYMYFIHDTIIDKTKIYSDTLGVSSIDDATDGIIFTGFSFPHDTSSYTYHGYHLLYGKLRYDLSDYFFILDWGWNNKSGGLDIAAIGKEFFILGNTSADNITTSNNAFQNNIKGNSDYLLMHINSVGNADFISYLGGNQNEGSSSSYMKEWIGTIKNSNNKICVTGVTYSTDFLTTDDAFKKSLSGSANAFIMGFNPINYQIDYSSYFGGNAYSEGDGIAYFDNPPTYLLAGLSSSTDLPTTSDAYQKYNNGQIDGFITILTPNKLAPATIKIESLSDLVLCQDEAFTISFTSSESQAGVTNYAYLSESNGNFQNSQIIGQRIGKAGPITAKIPKNIPTGNGYKIRIVSSNSIISDTVNIIINPLPQPVINGNASVIQNGTEIYSSNSTNGTSDIWIVSGGSINGPSNDKNVNIVWGNQSNGFVRLVQTNSFGCTDSTQLNISIGQPGSIVLEAGNASSPVGNTVEIPIYLKNIQNISQSGVTGIKTDLSFNATILEPINYYSNGIVNGKNSVTLNNLPITPGPNEEIARVKFYVGLGNARETILELTNYSSIGGIINLSAVNGTFTITGLCEQGGTRLANPNNQVQLCNIIPNPTSENIELEFDLVEKSCTKILIINLLGQDVRSFVINEPKIGNNKINIPIEDLSNGTYFMCLQTPTVKQVQKFEIFK
jgi:hypothetical protein